MVDHPREQTNLMSLDEYVTLYETEGPFELINGERVPVNPTVSGHGEKSRIIHDEFAFYNRQHGTGISYFEQSYVLTYSSNWVKGAREPDVMVYRMERIMKYRADDPKWADKPFLIVPDLVVEVISQNDRYVDVDAKVELYLEDGVEIIWVVDPKQKTVTVRGQGSYQKLKIGEVLTGGNVIPGFELAVEKIFE
jgi:Uma2 family endonuclease